MRAFTLRYLNFVGVFWLDHNKIYKGCVYICTMNNFTVLMQDTTLAQKGHPWDDLEGHPWDD